MQTMLWANPSFFVSKKAPAFALISAFIFSSWIVLLFSLLDWSCFVISHE